MRQVEPVVADALDHLERAIAGVPAAGAGEAVVQVLIAAGRVQGPGGEAREQALAEELDVVRLLLRSPRPALARGSGIDLAAYGAAHYGRSDLGAPPVAGAAAEPSGAPPAAGD